MVSSLIRLRGGGLAEWNPEERPSIPAEIKRRVLVEAGHRCAIPTCRHIEVDIHHIVPWRTCQAHEYENLIALCPNCHRRADREEIDRKSLKLYKLNLRFVHEKYSQIEMDMLFDLARAPDGVGAPWTPFMLIFFKRVIDSGFVNVYELPGGIFVNGIKSSPSYLTITELGRNFISELGDRDLLA
ncbi:HNH endonuclease [Caulobacter vibrioides]|uniref:HNH nuclease domain-containing protein n=1 Tax=Caulobacter vibrioides (strain ATCC 19089 / CIP 103742 / CB 15) TaxID=190650 RepID=Q9A758_CAUVC|nr:hypothetical protein CC_1868 [Caulobacter vibrioides CB15]ATC28743.1 HNH endonuclease [Caulobacter vibrioides]AZH12994.1 HNH endonuclease [Caulobacter vibrioides]